ncbi:MAG: RnfABCDGE type electron transport complex subunit D, partial [Candidatus Ratteibacteria bacterium]|nr:RnfABCDGE type electron transport complex subunit D [Candidatus Ratteibacteria bacterium]
MDRLTISISPHIKDETNVKSIMWGVIAALLPAIIWGVLFFQANALYLILTCIIAAVLSEAVCQKILKRPLTIADGSAFLTGLLLALVLPPSFPLWAGALGALVSIVIGKHMFGGLGYNIFNPALLGRAFLSVAFPVFTTTWKVPAVNAARLLSEGKLHSFFSGDAVTGATPLALALPKFDVLNPDIPSYLELFFGMRGGCIGEVSA